MSRLTERIAQNAPMLVLLGVYVGMRSLYWRCAPIWDGMINYWSIVQANEAPFDLLNYGIDGHICQGLFLVLSLPWHFYERSFYSFNIWLTLFSLISIATFYNLSVCLCGDSFTRVEKALVTALFALHPSVLSNMIHLNVDIGILTFFLLYWLQLMKSRTVLATIFAVLLAFSKETGALLLPLPFLFCLYRNSRGVRVRWVLKNIIVLVLPYVTLGTFLLYKTMFRHVPAFWIEYRNPGIASSLMALFSGDALFTNFIVMIFVLNFNWLLCLLGLALIALTAFKRDIVVGTHLPTALLLYSLFCSSTLLLLLVRPYSHVRYLIVLFPIMILTVLYWTMATSVPRLLRVSVMVSLLVCFVIEDFRTVDPWSRSYFGTFVFGNHRLLSLTRPTAEASHFGVDQLVYNLEFLKMPQLLNNILKDVRPNEQTVLLAPTAGNRHMVPFIDKSTGSLTFEAKNSFLPQYITLDQLNTMARPPAEVYYLAFPNCATTTADLAYLAVRYATKVDKLYNIDGYGIIVSHFTK